MATKTKKGFIIILIIFLAICGGFMIADSVHDLIGGKIEYTIIVGIFGSILCGFFLFYFFYEKLRDNSNDKSMPQKF